LAITIATNKEVFNDMIKSFETKIAHMETAKDIFASILDGDTVNQNYMYSPTGQLYLLIEKMTNQAILPECLELSQVYGSVGSMGSVSTSDGLAEIAVWMMKSGFSDFAVSTTIPVFPNSLNLTGFFSKNPKPLTILPEKDEAFYLTIKTNVDSNTETFIPVFLQSSKEFSDKNIVNSQITQLKSAWNSSSKGAISLNQVVYESTLYNIDQDNIAKEIIKWTKECGFVDSYYEARGIYISFYAGK
jgi:hypothetical protein